MLQVRMHGLDFEDIFQLLYNLLQDLMYHLDLIDHEVIDLKLIDRYNVV
jgi:hypothetical protein